MRAGRLISLLTLLQAGRRLTARQLADELEVSERTVLRDIEALSGAGIAVYAVRGRDGGFALLDSASRVALPAVPVGPRTRISRARLRLSPEGLQLATLLGRPAGLRRRNVPPDQDGWIEVTARVESGDAFIRDTLALANHVEVLAPADLRWRLRVIAEQIFLQHDDHAGRGLQHSQGVGTSG